MFSKLNLLAIYRKRKALRQLKLAAIEINEAYTDNTLNNMDCYTCTLLRESSHSSKAHIKTYTQTLYALSAKYIQYANSKHNTKLSLTHDFFITELAWKTPLTYAELRREWLQFIIDYKG